MKTIIIILLILFVLSGCKEPEPVYIPLSTSELETLRKLNQEIEILERKHTDYNNESKRIKVLEETYFSSISFDNLSLYKSNQFKDGLERFCYSGFIENKGNEIVEQLTVEFVFYDEDQKTLLNRWKRTLLLANDKFLDKTHNTEDAALILSISGRVYPLKPKERRKLDKNGTCMPETFLNWNVKNVNIEKSKISLRPKVSDYEISNILKKRAEIAILEVRARANNQL